jgi:hypothetical protein
MASWFAHDVCQTVTPPMPYRRLRGDTTCWPDSMSAKLSSKSEVATGGQDFAYG